MSAAVSYLTLRQSVCPIALHDPENLAHAGLLYRCVAALPGCPWMRRSLPARNAALGMSHLVTSLALAGVLGGGSFVVVAAVLMPRQAARCTSGCSNVFLLPIPGLPTGDDRTRR